MKRAVISGLLLSSLLLSACTHGAGEGAALPEVDRVTMDQKAALKKERTDDWSADKKLSDIEAEGLTLLPKDSEPVRISFEERKAEGIWDYRTGGAEAEYAFASIDGEGTPASGLVIDGYNEWVTQTAHSEVTAAKERWDRYHLLSPDSFIALTPWVGMKLTRSDSSVISFVTTIRRYNRDYEPDDDFYYGHTYDAQTGKELSLGDFVTDTDRLADALLKTLAMMCSGYYDEKKEIYLDEGFKERVRKSIEGCRDDGLFAWSIGQEEFVFYLVDPFYKDGYLFHRVEEVLVPFEVCSDFLRQDMHAGYDYVSEFSRYYLKEIYGENNLPEKVGKRTWYTPYIVQKDGEKYFYFSGDDEIQTYKVSEDGLLYVSSVTGSIDSEYSSTFKPLIDPEEIDIEASAFLLVELLQLRSTAEIAGDGTPRLRELFTPEYNIFPMMLLEELEADVFSDENATKSKKKKLPSYTELFFVRTDAASFIDFEMSGQEGICRLYITGSYEEGFMVNGHPADEVIQTQVIYEE